MSPTLVAVSLLLTFSYCTYIVGRALLGPLAKVPSAHWSSRFSNLWIGWIRLRGQEHVLRRELHCRLGPVFLIGPNEMSVNCIDNGVHKVYGGGFDKSAW